MRLIWCVLSATRSANLRLVLRDLFVNIQPRLHFLKLSSFARVLQVRTVQLWKFEWLTLPLRHHLLIPLSTPPSRTWRRFLRHDLDRGKILLAHLHFLLFKCLLAIIISRCNRVEIARVNIWWQVSRLIHLQRIILTQVRLLRLPVCSTSAKLCCPHVIVLIRIVLVVLLEAAAGLARKIISILRVLIRRMIQWILLEFRGSPLIGQ